MGYLTAIKHSMYVISKENNVHCLSRAHIIVIMSWLIISCPTTQYFAHIHSQPHNLIIPTMPSQSSVYGHNTALYIVHYVITTIVTLLLYIYHSSTIISIIPIHYLIFAHRLPTTYPGQL